MSPLFRIVVLGQPAAGKTSLVRRFIFHDTPNSYDPTIEDFYQIEYSLDNEHLRVQIMDTSGRELFPGMRQPYLHYSHGFVVVYSVKNRGTFLAATRICQGLGPVPKILVGSKADVDLRYREVTVEEGKQTARRLSCSFAETSSISGVNSREIVEELLLEIREQQGEERSRRGRGCCCLM